MRFLDRYEPLVRLAEGGMAEVYAARVRGEAGFEKLVALKRMLPQLAEEPRFVDMFLDEARLAAMVQSPNVVQTLDLGRAEDGSLFLVMELVWGVSVSRLQKAALRKGLALPPAVVLALVVEAASGLHDAHESRHPDGQVLALVHRDVSPQNLLVDEQGQVRVTDFGIARALERRTRSMSGEVKGKIAYFSPEQAAGEPVDRRTDVYALGVVAWELLAGRRLFEAADTQETLERLQAPLPPSRELEEKVDRRVVEVVYRALERAPRDRYATAAAFAEALRSAAREAGLVADRAAVGAFVREAAGGPLETLRARLRTARGANGERESVRSDAPTRARPTPDSAAGRDVASTRAEPASGRSHGKPERRRSSPDAPTTVNGHGRSGADGAGSTEKETPVAPAEPTGSTEHVDRDPATWGPSARARRGRIVPEGRRSERGWLPWAVLALAAAAVGLFWWHSPWAGDRQAKDRDAPGPGVAPVGRADAGERARPVQTIHSARAVLRIGGRPPRRFRGGFLAEGLYTGMLRRSPHGRWVPHVALARPSPTGPETRMLSGGQMSVTWRLRRGMRWSDGRPLRAADLVFGLQVYAPPELLKATAKDEHTVEVLWRDRVAVAFRSLNPLPLHVLEPVYKKGGSEAVLELLRLRPVPGLGPYRVAPETSLRKVVLVANPHYAGPPPAIRRVELHLLPGPELQRRFLAGTLDLTLPNAIVMETARRLRRARPTAVHLRPSNKQIVLQPDLRHPLLAKRQVRQALLQAIDRERIVREVYGRFGRVSHLPIARIRPTGLRKYRYAPKLARQALAKAGALGARIPLLHGTNSTGRKIARLVAADLGRVGLKVELQQWPFVERRTRFRKANHGGLLLYGLRGLRSWPLRHWWSVPQRQGRYLRTARHAALDDGVAELMARAARALDWRKRRNRRDLVWVAYSDRLPHLPLVFATERILADPALRGWDFQAGRAFGVDLAHWYFTR